MNDMTTQVEACIASGRRVARSRVPQQWSIVALRETIGPEQQQLVDTPELAAEYWEKNVATDQRLNHECETLVVLLLNTRRRIKGHVVVSMGTMDTLLTHPREVFRAAIIASAHSIIIMHNHPSGDPTPSEADIKVTRDLQRAGQLVKIEVLDHVIVGTPGKHSSLRTLGYMAF